MMRERPESADDRCSPSVRANDYRRIYNATGTVEWLAERFVIMTVCLNVLCLGVRTASAADPGSRERGFLRALELFDSAMTPDDYRSSARELESIVADGFRSGVVYFNLGNAYYRAGDYGRAILNYRKAKPYRPRDTYLEANLQQALTSAPGRLSEQPGPWWSHVLFWNEWLSYPAKVKFTGLAAAIAAVIVVMAVVLRRPRMHLIAVALCCVSLTLGIDAVLSNPESLQRAVITGEIIARKGTGKDYEPAFDQPLRDGAEFTVLSETSDWTFGHFEGIGDGWVRNEFVAK